MSEKLVLQPPEVVDVEGDVVFLGGPIQGAPDWQSEAIDIIHGLDSGLVVASPRKNYPVGTFVYENQVDWETHFLNRAARHGVIMFWLAGQVSETPGRAYGQTSRFELGEWKQEYQNGDVNLVLGLEEGYGNAKYIRRRFGQDCPDVPILDSLHETCKKTVEILNKGSDHKF